MSMSKILDKMYKEAETNSFKALQDNKKSLTEEERAIVKEKKATWSDGRSAVWKSEKDGKTTYVTHTHRAYNTAPTLKGAIGRFHDFIKSTASEVGIDNEIEKTASDENAIGKDGKIPAIENACSCPIAREVATMMATSHEYKTPNVDGALATVKNYKWEKDTMKVSNMQGINKPVKKEKVLDIAIGIKGAKGKVNPFIVVNQLHGIRPQSPGKKILLDGHHRKEACEFLDMDTVPVYKGTYTGNAELSKEELREKSAIYNTEDLEKLASRRWKEEVGKLSKKSIDKLRRSGILNYKKELSGLNKGTSEILRKTNTKIVNAKEMPDLMLKSFKGNKATKSMYNNAKKQYASMGINDVDNVLKGGYDLGVSGGGGFSALPSQNPKYRAVVKGEVLNNSTFKMANKGKLHTQGSRSHSYSNAILNRHEADEIRFGLNQLKNKKTHIDYKGGKISLGSIRSHLSPKVLLAESANTAIAPKATKDNLMRYRGFTDEVKELKAMGLNYGESGLPNKRLGRKLERSIAKENRKEMINYIPKDATYNTEDLEKIAAWVKE